MSDMSSEESQAAAYALKSRRGELGYLFPELNDAQLKILRRYIEQKMVEAVENYKKM